MSLSDAHSDRTSADLKYSAYNRTSRTRTPPGSERRGREWRTGSRAPSADRSRERTRRDASPHPSRVSLRSAASVNAVIPFDPTKKDSCANCGHQGHLAKDCKHPIDKERVKKNIELFVKHKSASVQLASVAVAKAMATELYREQCENPSEREDETDVDATDAEDSLASDEGEDEEEEALPDSARSQRK